MGGLNIVLLRISFNCFFSPPPLSLSCDAISSPLWCVVRIWMGDENLPTTRIFFYLLVLVLFLLLLLSRASSCNERKSLLAGNPLEKCPFLSKTTIWQNADDCLFSKKWLFLSPPPPHHSSYIGFPRHKFIHGAGYHERLSEKLAVCSLTCGQCLGLKL